MLVGFERIRRMVFALNGTVSFDRRVQTEARKESDSAVWQQVTGELIPRKV